MAEYIPYHNGNPVVDISETIQCKVCPKEAKIECTICHGTSYCSAEHLKQDSISHRSVCAAFRVKDDLDRNHCYERVHVATRNLPAGTVILEELPVFQYPGSLDNELCPPYCVVCGVNMAEKGVALNRCSICQWPVCGQECERLPIHALNDCDFFTKFRIRFNDLWNLANDMFYKGFFSNLVLLIRAWAMHLKDESFMEFFQGWIPPRADDALPDSNPCATHQTENFLTQVSRIVSHAMTKDVQYGLRVVYFDVVKFTSQSFEVKEGMDSETFPSRRANFFYPKAGLFSHACSPNCSWAIGDYPDFKIIIRTAVAVEKGELLTVSRFKFHDTPLLSTKIRQELFFYMHGFHCKCKLCLDPTENETMMSGVFHCTSPNPGTAFLPDGTVVWTSPENGYLLPVSPPVANKNGNLTWECTLCRITVNDSVFPPNLNQVFNELSNVINNTIVAPSLEFADDLESPVERKRKYCERIIAQYSGKIVHPNNFLIQCATRGIRSATLQLSVQGSHNWSQDNVDQFFQCGSYLLGIMDKVFPGISHERAHIIRSDCQVRLQLLTSYLSQLQGNTTDTISMHLTSFQELLEQQKQAYDFYKKLPPSRGLPRNIIELSLQTDMDTVKATINQLKVQLGVTEPMETLNHISQWN